MKRRVCTILICLALCLSMLPLNVLAGNGNINPSVIQEQPIVASVISKTNSLGKSFAASSVGKVERCYDGNHTYYYELTGDDVKEEIYVKTPKGNEGPGKVVVKINGKKIFSADDAASVKLQYFKLNSKQKFLFLIANGYNGFKQNQTVIRYDSKQKKYVTALNLKKYTGAASEVLKINGNTITLGYEARSTITSQITWKYKYKYNSKTGKFKIVSPKAKVKVVKTSFFPKKYEKYAEKNKLKTACKVTFYKDKKCTKKAFTVKKNKFVKLLKIYATSSGKTVFLYKYGSKKGWLKPLNGFNNLNLKFQGIIIAAGPYLHH